MFKGKLGSNIDKKNLLISDNSEEEMHQTDAYVFRVVFWDILPCKMIVGLRFRGDDGGSTHF
jgi:hypothetical protein